MRILPIRRQPVGKVAIGIGLGAGNHRKELRELGFAIAPGDLVGE